MAARPLARSTMRLTLQQPGSSSRPGSSVMRKVSIMWSMSAGSPSVQITRAHAPWCAGRQAVHEGDLPLLHLGGTAHDLRGALAHGHHADGARVHGSASAQDVVMMHRPESRSTSIDRPMQPSICRTVGMTVVADVGDADVDGLRVSLNGGGTGVHATTPSVCRRRPGGIAACPHGPRRVAAKATVRVAVGNADSLVRRSRPTLSRGARPGVLPRRARVGRARRRSTSPVGA